MNDNEKTDQEKERIERIIREDQFWCAATVVGFNAVVLGLEAKEVVPGWLLGVASLIVSLLGVQVILTRWLHLRLRQLSPEQRAEFEKEFMLDQLGKRIPAPTAPIGKRVRHRYEFARSEARAAWNSIREVVAEMSGSFFFIVLIGLTFLAVVARCFS